MSWAKEKYVVSIKHGEGKVITKQTRGYIKLLSINPNSKDTIWSMNILDRDNDCIYSIKDHEGQLTDRQGIPVGKDQLEKLTFNFYELTKNEDISIILNIEETI